MKKFFLLLLFISTCLHASINQTDTTTPVNYGGGVLPFTVSIDSAGFMLPMGWQSGVAAIYEGEYLLVAGRTNGLHGFDNTDDNFPPLQQNTTILVVNPYLKKVYTRSLYDPRSGLSQTQIDTLSVTSPQFYQTKKTLYITGGYGVDSSTGNFSTKDTLTAIDLKGLICWVKNPQSRAVAGNYIRQISHPAFQVTGGQMFQVGKCPTLLIFGQNFPGFYTGTSSGIYTQQVRRFYINDDGKNLRVEFLMPTQPDPSFRRRDLNIIPILQCAKKKQIGLAALSGVFTIDGGVWTVPVEICAEGHATMADPSLASTFKQGMNNYACAHATLFSPCGDTYCMLFGGITFGFFEDTQFGTDAELPFTNQVTVIKRDKNGNYAQFYLPDTTYPTWLATFSNPGNVLLFGAGAQFVPAPNILTSAPKAIDFGSIKCPVVIGYIIGGIQSTLPFTFSQADSAASPYIFAVTLTPK